MTRDRIRPSSAFTLVELLVVIAIIGILVGLLLPAVQAAREAARRTQCTNNLKQLGLALHNFHDTYRNFPPGGSSDGATSGVNWCHRALGDFSAAASQAPWTVLILPYIEQETLHDKADFNNTFRSLQGAMGYGGNAANDAVTNLQMSSYQCPSDPNSGSGVNNLNYFGVQGGGTAADASCTGGTSRYWMQNGILFHNSDMRFRDITDGTAHTYLVGETKYQQLAAGNPSQYHGWASSDWFNYIYSSPATVAGAVLSINSRPAYPQATFTFDDQTRVFGSWHPGGCQMLRADGSVEFASETMDLTVHQLLGKRNDGTPLGG